MNPWHRILGADQMCRQAGVACLFALIVQPTLHCGAALHSGPGAGGALRAQAAVQTLINHNGFGKTGTPKSTANSNGTGTLFTIDPTTEGTKGANVFHSFSQFNLGTNDIAYFTTTGVAGVDRIFAR